MTERALELYDEAIRQVPPNMRFLMEAIDYASRQGSATHQKKWQKRAEKHFPKHPKFPTKLP